MWRIFSLAALDTLSEYIFYTRNDETHKKSSEFLCVTERKKEEKKT